MSSPSLCPSEQAGCQDYEVADISCAFSSDEGGGGDGDRLTARLRKPEGFRGAPIFADARQVDAATDERCRIAPDPKDSDGLTYDLRVEDLDRCGVLRKNVSCGRRIKIRKNVSCVAHHSGLRERAHLVPSPPGGGHDVRPGGHHHVQAGRVRGHQEEGGGIRRTAVSTT